MPSIKVSEISNALILLKKFYQRESCGFSTKEYRIALKVINDVRNKLELRRRSREGVNVQKNI